MSYFINQSSNNYSNKEINRTIEYYYCDFFKKGINAKVII